MTNLTELSTLQMKALSYEEQFLAKENALGEILSTFYKDKIKLFRSPEQNYRMRAEFRVWHEGADTYHVMFDQQTKEKYRVDTLPSACELINNVMQATIAYLIDSPSLRLKLFQIDYLATTSGELVVTLLYHKKLDDQWLEQANALAISLHHFAKINIIGRAKKQKLVVGSDYVTETLTINKLAYSFKQIENSFTQPNAFINVNMIEWVISNLDKPSTDLLELYCGAGNFSIPLSRCFRRVLATEISKTSVKAAQDNIRDNAIENLIIARLSSEEFVEAYTKVRAFTRLANIDLDDYQFSTVLVDPPRAGLDDTTLSLISKFDTIVYISCNPNSLVDNLEVLTKTHSVINAALFDQFPFTHHIESGVILHKR